MIILHMYTPGNREADQVETWRALEAIRPEYPVLDLPCGGPHGYEHHLISRWGLEDFIICEQDLVPALWMIDSLVACPEPLCAQVYKIYPVSTLQPEPMYAQFVHWHGGRRPITDEDTHAHECGFGLTKISREVQMQVEPGLLRGTRPGEDWRGLDSRFFWALRGRGHRSEQRTLFHLHRPEIEHNHR